MSGEVYAEVVSRGQTMRGMIHRPAEFSSARRFPAVMLWHGFTGTRVEPHRLLVKTARALAERGIVAARFDFIGSGESDGEFVEMTPETEIADALNLIQWIQSQPGVDRTRLGLLGLSLGGFVSACAAARSQQIAALALWSAPVDMEERIRQRATPEDARKLQEQGWVDLHGYRVGAGFFESAARVRPLRELAEYSGRALIAHGTADQTVPVEEAHQYAAALGHCEPALHLINGADHTFNSAEWERDLITTSATWLSENL